MLEEYQKKRDFTKTREPPPRTKAGKGELTFVVQKHQARQLHYDLRLELDGVLKSWAVPNGPSLDPAVKRLAVQVEDHPLDYGGFEGNIPQGEYGAGEVIVWDKGTYQAQDEDKKNITGRKNAEDYLRSGLEKGKIAFELHGSKLKGSWALVRMQRTQKNWLLIKHKDEYADSREIKDEKASVISGLDVDDLKKKASDPPAAALNLTEIKGAKKTAMPEKLSPMLATLIKKPFSDPQWLFEPKLDGYRILAFVRDGQVKLISRRGLDTTDKYPLIKTGLEQQKSAEMVLDGELVALDAKGRTCFQCLQDYANPFFSRSSGSQKVKFVLIYYVFDILYLNGYSLLSVPLKHRKELLKTVLLPNAQIRQVEYFENEGETLFEAAVKQGLEGVVAKRLDSRYEAGKRSQDWLKVKVTQSDEFVIGGFTQGSGNREETFGALLLGSHDKNAKLLYKGSVGTGFDERLLVSLRRNLEKIAVKTSPFKEIPSLSEKVTWVKPELIAEVKYAEITREGNLRAPVFLRLREDKSPKEVRIREEVENAPR